MKNDWSLRRSIFFRVWFFIFVLASAILTVIIVGHIKRNRVVHFLQKEIDQEILLVEN